MLSLIFFNFKVLATLGLCKKLAHGNVWTDGGCLPLVMRREVAKAFAPHADNETKSNNSSRASFSEATLLPFFWASEMLRVGAKTSFCQV